MEVIRLGVVLIISACVPCVLGQVCTGDKPYTQVCENCEPYGVCDAPYDTANNKYRGTQCNDTCSVDATCEAVFYDVFTSHACRKLPCGLVNQAIGTHVFRKTCNQDCLTYEVERYADYAPTCAHFSGATAASDVECMNACLDIDTCRAAFYDPGGGTCRVLACTDKQETLGNNYVYWLKRCKDECSTFVYQECLNCAKGPDCPYRYELTYKYTGTGCQEWCEAEPDCQMSELIQDQSQCALSYCGQFQLRFGSRSFRRTCNTDCPRFEIFRIVKAIGNCANILEYQTSGMNEHTCLERCFEVPGCVSVTYDMLASTCKLHDCTDYTATAIDVVFYKRVCKPECDRIYAQKCTNCRVASVCQRYFDHRNWKRLDRQCLDLCLTTYNESCLATDYEPSNSGLCKFYDCTNLEYYFGKTAFRMSCSADCPEFTLDVVNGVGVTCSPYDTDVGGVTVDYCLDKCLDTDGCRAVIHNSATLTCQYYTCSDVSALAGLPSQTLIRRLCEAPCTRQYEQTCLNCGYGPDCQSPLTHNYWKTTPGQCYALCAANPDCVNAVYRPMDSGLCYQSACTALSVTQGYSAYRMSCASDCTLFKVKTVLGRTANCSGYSIPDPTDDVSMEHCLSKCVDTEGCRGVTYNAFDMTCLYHNCSSLSDLELTANFTFVRRVCIQPCDRLYWQTCYNCDLGHSCQNRLDQNHWDAREQDCLDTAMTYPECETGVYRPYESGLCVQSACNKIRIRHNTLAFRKSCSNDCLTFKLEQWDGRTGNCDGYSMEEDDYELLPLEYCIAKCLDTVGCRGVTHNATSMTCLYHNCDTYKMGPIDLELTFIGRICTTRCNRTYTEKCVNCRQGPYCQNSLHTSNWNPTFETCTEKCDNNPDCRMSLYNSYDTTGDCTLYECTELKIDLTTSTYRRSCAADCPEYKLTVMVNHTGDLTCTFPDAVLYIYDYHDCLEICLDTEFCRGATYIENSHACLLHHCYGNQTAGADTSSVFVNRDCDLQDCNRAYTQTCRGCDISFLCPTRIGAYEKSWVALDYMCTNYTAWQLANLTASKYDPSVGRCDYWSCPSIMPGFYADTVYRKSCASDCLDFRLFSRTGYSCLAIILKETSTFDSIPDAYYCIDECLDMEGCRGLIYDHLEKRCYFTDTCYEGNLIENENFTFIERECLGAVNERQNTQVCHNCGAGPACQMPFFQPPSYNFLDYDCNATCQTLPDCYQATYDATTKCKYIQCSQVKQLIGGTVYRMTNTSTCLEFELFTYPRHAANCSVIEEVKDANGPEHCLDLCLEVEACRGTTFYSNTKTCQHTAVCNGMDPNPNATYVQRVCWTGGEQCPRLHTQECVNCKAGPQCQLGWSPTGSQFKPKDITFSRATNELTNPKTKQIWLSYQYNILHRIQCSQVTMSVGDRVWRAGCSAFCPHFDVFIHPMTMGTCPETSWKAGSLSIEYCMEMCLDAPQCTAVTFDVISLSCSFHVCNNYTESVNHTFFRRECFDPLTACVPSVTQTCHGCKKGPNCHGTYNTIIPTLYYEQDCKTTKLGDVESQIGYYDRPNAQCYQYQCSQVDYQLGHVVYRESCNTDCDTYDMLVMDGYVGTCDVMTIVEGGINFHYCVETCLDLPGCRATTFNSTSTRCELHNCSEGVFSGATDIQFMQKICHTPVLRQFQQICLDCARGSWCQASNNPSLNLLSPTREGCFSVYASDMMPPLITYNIQTAVCAMVDCTAVQQNMLSVVFRRSPIHDCMHYRLFTVPGHVGTCPVIDSVLGGVSAEYCIDKCLDLDGCRAVSYNSMEMSCLYHNCTERTANASYSFVKRMCIDDIATEMYPPKPHTQTCHNCFSFRCLVSGNVNTVATSPGTKEYGLCRPDCAGCEYTQYIANTLTCVKKECDLVHYLSGRVGDWWRGTKALRRTNDSDCLEYELLAYMLEEPLCEAFDYDEGIPSRYDVDWCVRRCLDIPGCRAAAFHPATLNCTYHTCTEHQRSSVVSSLTVRKCMPDCSGGTMQTCMNCKPGTDCAVAYMTTSVSLTNCADNCGADPDCFGTQQDIFASPNTCGHLACRQPDMLYQSQFYRDSCNTHCPVYEMYVVQDHYGTCTHIPEMTEQYVRSPHVCYERCLETPECRAVSHFYLPGGPPLAVCYYHTCDCSEPGHIGVVTEPATFMWKYCLSDITNATTLIDPLDESSYPKTTPNTTCNIQTTTSPLTSTTTDFTTTVTTTEYVTVVIVPNNSTYPPGFNPIYIMPCMCSSGEFFNLTSEEIIEALIQNLTIDAGDTSQAQRKRISVKDFRTSSTYIGTVGVAFICVIFSGLVFLDITHIIRAITQVYKNMSGADQLIQGTEQTDGRL